MAAFTRLSVAILILTLACKGYCICDLNNITIGTVRSGRLVSGKPEWKVEVTNKCTCSISQIKLSCHGFQTTEPVDPATLLKQGDNCLLNSGNSVQGSVSVRFSYAWDPPLVLWPVSAIFSC